MSRAPIWGWGRGWDLGGGAGAAFALAMALGATACDVPRRAPTGVGLGAGGSAGAPSGAGEGGPCARGFVVVSSDYQSTNVSLVDRTFHVASASLISSGSATAGLSTALGGDVALPTVPPGGDELLLLDRTPASVLTWVDLRSAEVREQLSVATGFLANPHDAVTVAADRVFITRFESNPTPGAEPFDAGGDLLVVDPRAPALLGRIDLAPALADEPPGTLPRPDRAALVGGRILVVLGAYAADFSSSASARVVAVDPETESIVTVRVLDGVHACSGLAVSPDEREIALACSGDWGGDPVPDESGSFLVRLATDPALRELGRVPSRDLGLGPIGMSVAYASPTAVLFTTVGQLASGALPERDDALVVLDLASGEARTLLRSDDDPFTLGEVACDGCGACALADAGRDVVHGWVLADDGLEPTGALAVDDGVGLPPRRLGTY